MFFGANSLEKLSECSHGDIVFLGVPVDSGLVTNSKVRYGPQKLREISIKYQNVGNGYFDMYRRELFLKGNIFLDMGDVEVGTTYKQTLKTAEKLVTKIIQKGMFPVLIGGDHSITIASLKAFKAIPLLLIYFDAHLDFNNLKSPYDLSSATVLRNVIKCNLAEEILVVGTRGYRKNIPDLQEFIESKIQFISSEEIQQQHYIKKIDDFLKKRQTLQKCYLSIDLDVLGFSDAPGVSIYEPGGISYFQLRSLVEYFADCCQIVGMDIAEYDPSKDINGITGITASKIILDTLGSVFNGRKQK
jgi:agmatinase